MTKLYLYTNSYTHSTITLLYGTDKENLANITYDYTGNYNQKINQFLKDYYPKSDYNYVIIDHCDGGFTID